MEAGILTAVQEQQLAQMIDDVLVFKNFFLELIDGYVAKALITLLDDKVIDKLKTDIKVQLAGVVDAAFAQDLEKVKQLSANLIASLIAIPGLDETTEGLIFKGAIDLLVGAILAWIAQKKAVPPITLALKK